LFSELWEDSVGAEKLVNVVRSGLAGEVKDIRLKCDLTLEVVCDQLQWQQSKLSRMENGEQCISAADLAALLVIYKVHGKARQRLLHLVDRQDEPGYWDHNSPVNTEPRTLMRLEPEATSIVAAEPLLIPGLAQIADYTRAVMKSEYVPAEQVGPRVEARRMRQSVITRDNPPKFDMIVHEAALNQVIGSHKVMARQLRALVELAELPNVRLWVVPVELAGNAGLNSPAYLMNFPRNKSVIYLENMISCLYLEDPGKIEFVRRRTTALARGFCRQGPAQPGAVCTADRRHSS